MSGERDRIVLGLRVIVLVLALGALTTSLTSAASPIRQLTVSEAANLRPVLTADGKRIAFQSNREGTYKIYVMAADGSDLKQISTGSVDDRHPAWNPDGTLIAVDSGDAMHREIWIIDVASKRRTQVTRTGAIASFPSWSPDGTRLAFYVYRSGAMDVWTSARDGSGATQLTQGLASEQQGQCTFACHSARWSPNGSEIAFANGDLTHVLVVAAAASPGTAPRAISPDGERNHFPVYLSDGTIVYVSEHLSLDKSWTDLWRVDPTRSDQRAEFVQGILAQGPFEISTDGMQLLFASPRDGNFEIYAVTLDGAGKAALATTTQPVAAMPRATSAPASGLPSVPPETYILIGLGIFVVAGELGYRALRRRRKTAA